MNERPCYKCGDCTPIAISLTIHKVNVEIPVCSVHKDGLLEVLPEYEAVCKAMTRVGVKPGIAGILVGRLFGTPPS